jgi:putative peptidoglycan lipid II flippase
MSQYAAKSDLEKLKEIFFFSFRLIFFITIPAMVGLILLRIPIITILFKRGEFDYQAVLLTSQSLLCYSLGLWAIAGIRVVVPIFYSLKDTKTPVKVAATSLIVNIIFSLILMGPMKHSGLALATSASSAFNLLILLVVFRIKIGKMGIRQFIISILKVSIASLVMGVVIYQISTFGAWDNNTGCTTENLLTLGTSILTGLGIFFIISYLLKNSEFLFLIDMIKGRRR